MFGNARNTETFARLLALAISGALPSQTTAAIADSAVIGWDGDKHGVIAHLNGSYRIRRDEGAPPASHPPLLPLQAAKTYDISFGIYDHNPSPTPSCTPLATPTCPPLPTPKVLWYNETNPPDPYTAEGGYLPCLVTRFERSTQQCTVWISHFGKEIFIRGGQDRFVFIYTRITIFNHGPVAQTVEPAPTVSPSSGPTPFPLTKNSTTVQANEWVTHDYVLAADRFAGTYAWPTESELVEAGSWDTNFALMAKYWDNKLSRIANVADLPDPELIRAYKAGYIYTLIVKDGDELRVGEEKYEDQEGFENDKVETLAALLTIGDPDGLKYLNAFPIGPFWIDYQAKLKYPWLWALYLAKYPDSNHIVREHLDQIQALAREIHEQDRCLTTADCSPAPRGPPAPNRLIKPRYGLQVYAADPRVKAPAMEYLAMDNWSALTGLASYEYICERLSDDLRCVDLANGIDERRWAESQYLDLFDAVSAVHADTIQHFNLNYLPVDMYFSNDPPILFGPWDANWAVMFAFGHWAWDAYLLGVPAQDGIELGMIDPTYISRFQAAGLECHNFGAFYKIGFSSAYNAGYGSAGLRGESFRSEGIHAFQFILKNGQSGPFSWWESFTRSTLGNTPWVGTHPDGQVSPAYSCPHTSGQATATKILIDSLIALKGDGSLIIGRGVPNEWVTQLVTEKKVIRVLNFPILNGDRMGFSLTGLPPNQIRLELEGRNSSGETILDLRALKNNINAVTAGTPSPYDGTVTLPSGITTTTVTLTTANPTPIPTPLPIMVALPISTLPAPISTLPLPVLALTIDAADDLIGFQGDLVFDSSVVTFEGTAVQPAGLTGSDWNVSGNVMGTNTIKTLRIVAYSLSQTTPLQGSGTLFELRMNRARRSRPNASTALAWAPPDGFFFLTSHSDRRAPASTPSGRITIAGANPTPSPTPISSPLNR